MASAAGSDAAVGESTLLIGILLAIVVALVALIVFAIAAIALQVRRRMS